MSFTNMATSLQIISYKQTELWQTLIKLLTLTDFLGFPSGSVGKESSCNAETCVWSLGWEDPLEKGVATHSSVLAWRIPWAEEPGVLRSMGSQRVGHD